MKILWLQDGTLPRYRIWRSDWFGDQFEIVDKQTLDQIEKVCNMFGIGFFEHEDDQ
jgi:hypothetical protein